MSLAPTTRVSAAQTILSGLSASLVGIGLARFGYTPLIPPMIDAHWFPASEVVRLGAANLAGYLIGALVARTGGARIGNATALRSAMLAVTLSFLACAFPLSVAWFFGWRLVSGVAGGIIMVLVAATLMPHVPAARRGVTSGAIFLGLGLGIAGSGTVVPLLLGFGLRATWIGLAAIAAAFTAASWFAWPPSVAIARAAAPGAATGPGASRRKVSMLYAQYALVGVGVVPPMVFLVDYVVHGLRAGTHLGALAWVLYGVGAIAGPPLYGLLGDRIGARHTLRVVLGMQALAIVALATQHAALALGVTTIVLGSFPAGVVPIVLARVGELEPHALARRDATWSRATVVFAAAQALSGYAFSTLFDASQGNHRLLFLVAAGAWR